MIKAKANFKPATDLLDRLKKAAQDLSKPMLQASELIDRRIRNTFATQTDPYGEAWAPWKHPDRIRKSRNKRGVYSDLILLDSGELFSSIERSSNSKSFSITMGDGVSEKYASVHQFGDANHPARKSMPLDSPEQAVFPQEWYQDIIKPFNIALEAAGK